MYSLLLRHAERNIAFVDMASRFLDGVSTHIGVGQCQELLRVIRDAEVKLQRSSGGAP